MINVSEGRKRKVDCIDGNAYCNGMRLAGGAAVLHLKKACLLFVLCACVLLQNGCAPGDLSKMMGGTVGAGADTTGATA